MKESIIIDVNIWISYFITSKTTELFDLIVNNDLLVYRDKYLRNELVEVINRGKFAKILTTETIQNNLLIFHTLTTNFNTEKKFIGSPDPKEDYLFDLAIQTNSRIIVTGDKRLLDFKIQNIEVISLSGFLKLL